MPRLSAARASLTLAALLLASTAHAQTVQLNGGSATYQGMVGVARLPSDARDKFGETISIGSGLAVDPTSIRRNGDSYSIRLLGLPDRGYNVAGTVDYRGRFQIFDSTLTPALPGATVAAGPGQQNQLNLNYRDTVLLREANGASFTGLDPTGVRPAAGGFPNLPIASNGRISLDSEGIVRTRDGGYYVSDEYGPYIYRFNSAGTLLSAIRPPNAFIPIRNGVENFSSNNPGPGGSAPVPADPTTGRQNNQGFEGLAISPGGKMLFTLLQSATRQDGGTGGSSTTRQNTRLLGYDISDPANPRLVQENIVVLPFYNNTATGARTVAAQSELLALNSTQFLVVSRDSNAGFNYPNATSAYRRIDIIDTKGATNIAGSVYDGTTPVAPGGVLAQGVTPVQYQSFIDVNNNAQLARFGLRNGGPNNTNNLYEKWEGLALVPRLERNRPNDFFLLLASDNDFITQNGVVNGQAYADPSGNNVDSLVLVYLVSLPTYIDPLALQSLEVTALPLARATADVAVGVAQNVTRDVGSRLFQLRTNAGLAQTGPRVSTYISGNFGFDRQGFGSDPTGRRATDPDTRVVTVGADIRIDTGTAVRLSAGFAVSYFDQDGKVGDIGKIGSRGFALTPYATASLPSTLGTSWLDLQYSYLRSDYRITRYTGAYDLVGHGTPAGESHVLAATIGHNFTAPALIAGRDLIYGPTGRVTYTRGAINAYSETDAILANAAVGGQRLNSTVLGIGAQASLPIPAGAYTITPQVRAGWDFDVSRGRRALTIGLAERPGMAEATVTGDVGTLPQSGFRGGAGVSLARGDMALVLDYDVRARTYGTTDHLVTSTFRLAF